MFAAPPEMTFEVFTEIPDSFRKTGRSAWADSNKRGAELHSFLEGPSFDRAGNLYVVDIPWGRIFRISPQGQWELAIEYDGWPMWRLGFAHTILTPPSQRKSIGA